ncbi:MAG: TetR family transcriptional regulator, partial [Bradyrhizobium sp.]
VALTERMLAEAFEKGQLKPADLKQVQIAGRALVYGFARMNVDGHFPRWGVAEGEAGRMAEAVLDLFIKGIAKTA